MEPKVSVIIPCFNVESYIKKCLQSLEDQTYDNLEIIVVDDGSTDKSISSIEEFAKSSKRSLSLYSQKNAGASTARNLGLLHSIGTYIQFLDADDFLLPSKLERQVGLMTNNSNVGFVVGSYRRIHEDDSIHLERKYQPELENVWLIS